MSAVSSELSLDHLPSNFAWAALGITGAALVNGFIRFRSSCGKAYTLYRKIDGYYDDYKFCSSITAIHADWTLDLYQYLSDPQMSVIKKIDLIQKVIFHSPLSYFARNNIYLSGLVMGWDCFKSTINLKNQENEASIVDYLELAAKFGKLFFFCQLNFLSLDDETEESYNNYFFYLEGFCHFLSKIKPKFSKLLDYDEIGPSILPNSILLQRELFLEDLRLLKLAPLSSEENKKCLEALVRKGITWDKLLSLELIPEELYKDKILAKYICAITLRPVRFPSLIIVNDEFKICERRILQECFSHQQQLIPNLGCRPSDMRIVQRLDRIIMMRIENRLNKICKKLAELENVRIPLIEENNFLGKWVIDRRKDQGRLSSALATIEDQTNKLEFNQFNIPPRLLKLVVITSCTAIRSYIWLENCISRFTFQSFVDPREFDTLDRVYS